MANVVIAADGITRGRPFPLLFCMNTVPGTIDDAREPLGFFPLEIVEEPVVLLGVGALVGGPNAEVRVNFPGLLSEVLDPWLGAGAPRGAGPQ